MVVLNCSVAWWEMGWGFFIHLWFVSRVLEDWVWLLEMHFIPVAKLILHCCVNITTRLTNVIKTLSLRFIKLACIFSGISKLCYLVLCKWWCRSFEYWGNLEESAWYGKTWPVIVKVVKNTYVLMKC